MASVSTPKIRLVRCPNCRKVLYETPGLTVYKCGGCDAVLVAKNQKVDGTETTSDLHNADTTNQSDNVSECKKSISLRNHNILPSSGECSMDPNDGMSRQDPLEECIINQLSDVNISNNKNQNFESMDPTSKQSEVVDEVCSSSDSTPEIPDEVHSSSESVLHENIKLSSSMAVNSDDSSPIVVPRRSQKSVRHGVDRLMSTDTFRSSDFVSPSSDLSDSLESMSKSQTMKTSHAYYDGSVSSYDDHIPDQNMHSFRYTDKDSRFVALEERHKSHNFFLNSDSDVQQQARNLFTVGNRRNENQFRVPSHPRGFVVGGGGGGYEHGGSSNQMWDDESTHRTTERREVTGEDKAAQLLRMVYVLQDQITKTNFLNETTTSGSAMNPRGDWKGKHVPSYYDQERLHQTRRELNYSRSQGGRGGYWSEHWPGQLPLPVHTKGFSTKGFSRIHSADPTYYDSYSSTGISQQRYMEESEFPLWRFDSVSDDHHRRGDHHVVRRRHVPKKHIRPIARGAPFVTCYRCLQPIQLPADFLILKRRCHLLKCGACSEVLKFSLRNKIHIVRYAPPATVVDPQSSPVVDPQSSPVDDASNSVMNGQLGESSITAKGSNGFQEAGSVSCLDDSERSFFGSFSDKLRGRKDVACRSSYDSSDTMEESAEVVGYSRGGYNSNSPGEAPTSHSSNLSRDKPDKFSAENAEVSGVKGSQLHQLMGYSSARELLRRSASELVDTGTSLYYEDENAK